MSVRHRLRTDSGARTAFVLVCVLTVGWELWALLAPADRVGTAPQSHQVVPQFASYVAVGQTFRPQHDGLRAVELKFFADQPTILELRCRLADLNGRPMTADDAIYAFNTTVRLPRGLSWQRFEFDPVPNSERRVYLFEIRQTGTRDAEGNRVQSRPMVGPVASAAGTDRIDGNLIVGQQQVIERHLAFAAYAADSHFDWYRLQINSQLPKWLRGKAIQLALLGLYQAMIMAFAYYVVVVAPDRARL